jgi:hypothetical protein
MLNQTVNKITIVLKDSEVAYSFYMNRKMKIQLYMFYLLFMS